jgi:hypothetical protein
MEAVAFLTDRADIHAKCITEVGLSEFAIYALRLGNGQVALCQMPGRGGDYPADLEQVIGWRPALVLTMATGRELLTKGAATLRDDLNRRGVNWRHLPVADFEADSPALDGGWAEVSALARSFLLSGGRVLVHCMGGCGRSGMAVLRLMVEAGEPVDAALIRLREVRPCAVETGAQLAWASR